MSGTCISSVTQSGQAVWHRCRPAAAAASVVTSQPTLIFRYSMSSAILGQGFPDEPLQGNFYVDGARFLRALNAIATSGAKVLNLSLGGTQSSQAEQLLFDRLERAGVTVVAAMGNEHDHGNRAQDAQLAEAHQAARHRSIRPIAGVFLKVLELVGDP